MKKDEFIKDILCNSEWIEALRHEAKDHKESKSFSDFFANHIEEEIESVIKDHVGKIPTKELKRSRLILARATKITDSILERQQNNEVQK